MIVELLVILDCPHADRALAGLQSAMAHTGIDDVEIRTTIVETDRQAHALRFVGSPSIRIDGHDPFPSPVSDAGLACRMYSTVDGLSGFPSVADLEAALRAACE